MVLHLFLSHEYCFPQFYVMNSLVFWLDRNFSFICFTLFYLFHYFVANHVIFSVFLFLPSMILLRLGFWSMKYNFVVTLCTSQQIAPALYKNRITLLNFMEDQSGSLYVTLCNGGDYKENTNFVTHQFSSNVLHRRPQVMLLWHASFTKRRNHVCQKFGWQSYWMDMCSNGKLLHVVGYFRRLGGNIWIARAWIRTVWL